MKPKEFPTQEYLSPGNASCHGCPIPIALRTVLKALGQQTVMVVPACCTSIVEGPFPSSAIGVPVLNVPFASAAAAASGVAAGAAALHRRGRLAHQPIALAWAGDGGTYDIGIQALSGAAERGADILYICYNNQMYGNTGVQRSGATPRGAWTTNTPSGKKEKAKEMALILAEHGIPYVATAALSYLRDLFGKVSKAKALRGTRYIEILAPCPPGWAFPSEKTIALSKLAVHTGLWPLFEIEEGKLEFSAFTRSAVQGRSKLRPIAEFLAPQGRFAHLREANADAVAALQEEALARFAKLIRWSDGADYSLPQVAK